MKAEKKETRFLLLVVNLSLLYIAIIIINSVNPLGKLNHTIYFLHAAIAEIITYTFYSKKSDYFQDTYKNSVKNISYRMIVFVLIVFVLAKYFSTINYSSQIILQYTGIFYILKIIMAYVFTQFLSHQRKNGHYLRNIAILGLSDADVLLGHLIERNPTMGFNLIGYIADTDDYDLRDEKILGEIGELENLMKKHQIQKIFVTPSKYFEVNNAREFLARCNKVGLKARYVMMNSYWNERRVNDPDYIKTLTIHNPQEIPLDNISNIYLKRLFDIMLATFAILFIFSWLFPIIALIIKLDSKGPVFCMQKRTGIDNRVFNCIKFRTTMENEASDLSKSNVRKLHVSKVGSFLRKYNLDELPQFINVLFGDMSVVGPQPHMLKYKDQYAALIDHYRVRHYVKPGITGWAQVNGYEELTDESWRTNKRVDCDMEYLRNWDFLWDMKIIYITLFGKNNNHIVI